MTRQDHQDALAVLILRMGLIWFMFLWAIHKVITPKQYQFLVKNFDGVEISIGQIYLVAGIQIAVCALAALGIFRVISYGALTGMHAFTISRQWERYLDPFEVNGRGFPVNRNMVIALAAMGGFIALMLLIRRDHYSVGGWLRRHMGPSWWQ